MKKMYSDYKNWDDRHYKKSFKDLENDGYSFERIEYKEWFDLDAWKVAVLCNKTAHKTIKETEKAIQFSVVNQYGNVYEIWFPKSVLTSY